MTDKMIVLANLGRVKAYRLTHDEMTSTPHLELAEDIEFIESHERFQTRVSDQAGHLPGTGNGEDHKMASENERRLIKQAAERIDLLVAHERVWVLAAPAWMNARLLESLGAPARAHLTKNVQADLVKVPVPELTGHFQK